METRRPGEDLHREDHILRLCVSVAPCESLFAAIQRPTQKRNNP